ncbi:tetratricopeptide repeat protein [Sphingobacterium kitahiroshimense]|uniref:Tetratricopeptide repeat protein n=1 Tax=Sphingobacterium kitahiroshimense TaxID=470446 RepID=A0ABV0BTR9_9SPHI
MKTLFNIGFAVIAIIFQSCAFVSSNNEKVAIEYSNDTAIQAITSKINNLNVEHNEGKSENEQEKYLIDIQLKIQKAANEGFVSKKTDRLDEIEKSLDQLYTSNKHNIILYWKSYLQYFKTIIYMQNSDDKNASKANEASIETLESIKLKNSEDYALYAMVKGLSFQYSSGIKAPFISSDIKDAIEKSIKLDPQNIRAYYVKGSNDFYTPKGYGGGKLVAETLKKAISLKDENVPNKILPSWGKEESYEMLIKFYIKNANWKEAIIYFNEALKKYPDNYLIYKLGAQLVGKG